MRPLSCWLALLLASASPLSAQILPTADPGRSERTRADLERLASDYQEALASPAYSEGVKRSIRSDLQRIRIRLEEGDFRTGDRVFVDVQGELEYPDTVAVEPGPLIRLPVFGDVSLYGVLRSEIESYLTAELSRFIRSPVVRASGQMRVGVIGAVGSPGYHTMPASTILGDALMLAGGPSSNAELDNMRIERGQQALFEGDEVQEAIRAGLSLDQLNLQAGDQIVVPAQSPTSNWLGLTATVIGAVGTLTFLLTRFF